MASAEATPALAIDGWGTIDSPEPFAAVYVRDGCPCVTVNTRVTRRGLDVAAVLAWAAAVAADGLLVAFLDASALGAP